MKKTALFLCLALICTFAACGGKDDSVEMKVNFVRDYAKGMETAKQEGKPVMLVFDADWCTWCKKLKKDVFSKDDVGKESQGLVNILVDIDKNPATAKKYNVRGVPSIFFMNPKGDLVMPYQGPREPESVIKVMAGFKRKFGKG